MIEHIVHLKPEDPIHIRQICIPLEHRQTIYDWVDNFLKKGAIEVSHSCFNSPICLVPKSHCYGMRTVLHFRQVNFTSIPDRYTIQECQSLARARAHSRSYMYMHADPS